jgi:hypothetical protein
MSTQCNTLSAMAKTNQIQDYMVRNFPTELLRKLRRVKREKKIPIYHQIIEAVREKFEREKEN